MAIRSLSEVKQQLCRLVPGWVTATVRVEILIDRSDRARSLTLGNNAACTSTSLQRSTLCLRLNLSSKPYIYWSFSKFFFQFHRNLGFTTLNNNHFTISSIYFFPHKVVLWGLLWWWLWWWYLWYFFLSL